nr:DNA helicase [Tanacetum cinerariifolium]
PFHLCHRDESLRTSIPNDSSHIRPTIEPSVITPQVIQPDICRPLQLLNSSFDSPVEGIHDSASGCLKRKSSPSSSRDAFSRYYELCGRNVLTKCSLDITLVVEHPNFNVFEKYSDLCRTNAVTGTSKPSVHVVRDTTVPSVITPQVVQPDIRRPLQLLNSSSDYSVKGIQDSASGCLKRKSPPSNSRDAFSRYSKLYGRNVLAKCSLDITPAVEYPDFNVFEKYSDLYRTNAVTGTSKPSVHVVRDTTVVNSQHSALLDNITHLNTPIGGVFRLNDGACSSGQSEDSIFFGGIIDNVSKKRQRNTPFVESSSKKPRYTATDRRIANVTRDDEEGCSSGQGRGRPYGYVDLGDCNQQCQHCVAAFWFGEHLKGHSNYRMPKYHLCCEGGRIHMQPSEDPPEYFKNLLQNKHFMENIRAYNQMFAMTSFGAKIDESINQGRDHEVENRMRHFGGIDDSDLDPEIVEGAVVFDSGVSGSTDFDVIIQEKAADGSTQEQKLTMLAYYSYQLHPRVKDYNLIFRTGRHFQQYVVGVFYAIEQSRLDYIRKKQKDIQGDHLSGLYDAISRGERDGYKVRGRIILLMSFTGGPRYMYAYYLDALAICRKLGNPQFFITFTCNVNWPEIKSLDNSYVVPYNQALLLAFEAHINVEYCGWSMLIKYLFKFISKGTDRIFAWISKPLGESSNVPGPLRPLIDEIQNYLEGRFVCAHEACWRILKFDIHRREPAVQILAVHLQGMQRITFRDRDNLESVVNLPSRTSTALTEWFAYNEANQDGRHLTYQDFPSEFVWYADRKSWSRRHNSKSYICCLAYVHPTSDDKRRLLSHVSRGTSTTFLWKTIISTLRSEEKIVLAVASSGITSLLLPSGSTVHLRFKLPLELTEESLCRITKNSYIGKLSANTNLIIWDEAPMNDRSYFEALDRSLMDILTEPHSLFGGKSVLLGGDFRQTLPVKKGASKMEVISSCISESELWSRFKVFTLTENIRLEKPNISADERSLISSFSSWLLNIGDGNMGDPDPEDPENTSWVDIPINYCIPDDEKGLQNLINFIYDQNTLQTPSAVTLQQKAIVCPKNETADTINSKVLKMVQGKTKIYLSHDEATPVDNDGA